MQSGPLLNFSQSSQDERQKTIADLFRRAPDDLALIEALVKLMSNIKTIDLEDLRDILARTTREKIRSQETRTAIFGDLALCASTAGRLEMLKRITLAEWPNDQERAKVLGEMLPRDPDDVALFPQLAMQSEPTLDELRVIRARTNAREMTDPIARGRLLGKLRTYIKPFILPDEYYGMFTEILDCALEAGPHRQLRNDEATFFTQLDLRSDFPEFSPVQRRDFLNRIIVGTPNQSQDVQEPYVWYESSVFVNQLAPFLKSEVLTFAAERIKSEPKESCAIMKSIAKYASDDEAQEIIAHITREKVFKSKVRADVFVALLQTKRPSDIHNTLLAHTTSEEMLSDQARASVLGEMALQATGVELQEIFARARLEDMTDPVDRGQLLGKLRRENASFTQTQNTEIANGILKCAKKMLSSEEQQIRNYGVTLFDEHAVWVVPEEETHSTLLKIASRVSDQETRAKVFCVLLDRARWSDKENWENLHRELLRHITRVAMPDESARKRVINALPVRLRESILDEKTTFDFDPTELKNLRDVMTSSPKRTGVAGLAQKMEHIGQRLFEKRKRQP